MARCLAIVAVLYGLGHPSLDGRRPAPFERSLREFHREVNQAMADGQRALAVLDDARSMRYLNSLNVRMQAMLAGG